MTSLAGTVAATCGLSSASCLSSPSLAFPSSLDTAAAQLSLNIDVSPSTQPSQAAGDSSKRQQPPPLSAYDRPFLPPDLDSLDPTPTLSLLPDIPLTAAPVLASSALAPSSPTLSAAPSRPTEGGARESGSGSGSGGARASPAGQAEGTRATAIPKAAVEEKGDIEMVGGEVRGAGGKMEKRWEGWETSTETVYVTNTNEVPTAVTMYTTYGESPVVDGGTITETIWKGADTVTVLGPSYLTLTFYPTTTTFSTSKTTIPTTTKTKTKTPAAQSTATICRPGDADKKEFTGLKPTHDQSITLYVIAICTIVGIGIGWNLFILRDLLYPFKVFTVAVHEVGHVLITICLGFRIGVLTIDPKVGGITRMVVGDIREHPIPFAALPMGYLFSIIVGGLLTFCGFNTLASKIASFIVGLCWIGVFLQVEVIAKIMTLLAVGLMVGLWFVDHAWGLRFYILFLGVMNSFYVLWDVADDAFFAKQNPCCPSLFFQAMPSLGPGIWTMIWFFLSFIFFIGFILAGLAAWKQDPHAMYCQAQTFLPTR
ncbi:hypothetical protein JCM6882_006238 [Rhodosporidiobolus microsporus]